MAERHLLTGGIALALALFLLPPAGEARVYQRWGGADDVPRALQDAGGRIAYRTEVTINGGKGRLAVAGFDQLPADVARQIGAAFGTNLASQVTGALTQATVRSGDRVVRLLILHLNRQARTLAIAIEQSREEYEASQAAPARRTQPRMPAFPDSRPRLFVSDDRANLSAEVSDTDATPEAVQAHFRGQFSRAGWQAVAPGGARSSAALDVFARGNEICCTYVGAGENGRRTITVLHKRQGLE